MTYVANPAGQLDLYVDIERALNILLRFPNPASMPTGEISMLVQSNLATRAYSPGTGLVLDSSSIRILLTRDQVRELREPGTWRLTVDGDTVIRGAWMPSIEGSNITPQNEETVLVGSVTVQVGVTMTTETAAHNSSTLGVHGITDTSELETIDGAQLKADLAKQLAEGTAAQLVAQHASSANPHPDYETAAEIDAKLDTQDTTLRAYAAGRVSDHAVRSTDVHGIPDTGQLETQSGAQAKANAAQNAAAAALAQHSAQATDVHDASAVSFVAGNGISSTNVQDAIMELKTDAPDLSVHTGDPLDAHQASAISFSPAGSVGATTVQGAIAEVSGDVDALTNTVSNHTTQLASHAATLASQAGALVNTTSDITALEAAVADLADGAELTALQSSVAVLAADYNAHEAGTINVHGIANTAQLETLSGAQTKADAAQAAATATAAAQLAAHTGDDAGAHAASAIAFTTTATIGATNVQDAIAEVATDAAAALATHAATAATDAEVAAAVTAHVNAADPHAQYTTSAEVTTIVNDTIGAASGTLEALQALADLLANDPDVLASLTSELAGKQPLDSDLTAIAALTTTAYGRSFLALANAAAGRTLLEVMSTAETNAAIGVVQTSVNGVSSNVTNLSSVVAALDTEVDALTSSTTAAIAAAVAGAQPLDSDLTAIAALGTTSFGRSFLALVDAAAARTLLGLGTAATAAASSFDAVGTGAAQAAAAQAAAIQRANHTGTQLANTISNFDTAVRANRLDQMAVPSASVSMNGQRVTNVAEPVAGSDAATRTWALSLINSLVAGAPTGLDTLAEIAAAINNDPTYSVTIAAQIAAINSALATINGSLSGFQPLDADLTALASVASTAFGRSLLTQGDAAALRTLLSVSTTAAIAAAYQPIDTDLTSIAALTTTAYGRSLLTLVDAAAARASIGAAAPADVTAAIAAATAALAAHEADTTAVHGIANTALLETIAGAQAKVDAGIASLGLTPVSIDMASHTGPIALTNAGYVTVLLRGGTYDLTFTWPSGLRGAEVELVDVTGGSTVTFSQVDRWAGAAAPVIANGAGERTTIGIVSPDGGVTVNGYSGQAVRTHIYEFPTVAVNGRSVPFITSTRTRILNTRIIADSAGTGGGPMVADIEADGVSAWSTIAASRPSLAAGATKGAVVNTFTTQTFAANVLLTAKIVGPLHTTPAQRVGVVMRYVEV